MWASRPEIADVVFDSARVRAEVDGAERMKLEQRLLRQSDSCRARVRRQVVLSENAGGELRREADDVQIEVWRGVEQDVVLTR